MILTGCLAQLREFDLEVGLAIEPERLEANLLSPAITRNG